MPRRPLAARRRPRHRELGWRLGRALRIHDRVRLAASGPANTAPNQNAISAATTNPPPNVALTPVLNERNGIIGRGTQSARESPNRMTPARADTPDRVIASAFRSGPGWLS